MVEERLERVTSRCSRFVRFFMTVRSKRPPRVWEMVRWVRVVVGGGEEGGEGAGGWRTVEQGEAGDPRQDPGLLGDGGPGGGRRAGDGGGVVGQAEVEGGAGGGFSNNLHLHLEEEGEEE